MQKIKTDQLPNPELACREIKCWSYCLTMTTQQIRTITVKATLLLEKIDELNSYIDQLTNGVMSTLGSKESNKQAIQEYNMRIINLETELKSLWKTT